MGDSRLHAVVEGQPRPRPGGPGPAVLSILLFGVLFVGALFFLRARSPLVRKVLPGPRTSGTAAAAAGTAGRTASAPPPPALLSGEGLRDAARAEYFRHLATDRCDCGCDRTLSDCLANEKACRRSPDLAEKIRSSKSITSK